MLSLHSWNFEEITSEFGLKVLTDDRQSRPKVRSPNNDAEILKAIKANSPRMLSEAIMHDANIFNPGGPFALVIAVENNADRVILPIIAAQRNASTVDFMNREFARCGLEACWRNRPRLLRLLLDGGLDPGAMDMAAPLMVRTIVERHFECFKLLFDRGASLTVRGSIGINAIDAACVAQSDKYLDELTKKRVDFNLADASGRTPLFFAANLGDHRRCQRRITRLISLGADASILDKNQQSAINNAMDKPEVVRILCEHGAPINQKDTSGLAPIHYAAEKGDERAWKCLILNGADPFIKTTDGRMAIEIAISSGHLACAERVERWEIRKKLLKPVVLTYQELRDSDT